MPNRRTVIQAIAFAIVVALAMLGVTNASATPPPADVCEKSFTPPMNSTQKLKAYNDCRFDRIEDILTSGASPSPSPSPSPTPSASESPSPPPTPSASSTPPVSNVLELPKIPWAGGNEYWAKFPQAKAGGWDKDTFFPVICWFCNISSKEEAQFDKSKGVNTYAGMSPDTDFNLFVENDLYWLGVGLKNQVNTSPNNPGLLLDDEADGYISPPSAAHDHLTKMKANVGPGQFAYANYTQLVVGQDMSVADQEKFVNAYTDAVSVDMYYYSIPACSETNYREGMRPVPVPFETCRTSHSYGLMMDNLTVRDNADGTLQPKGVWIENLNGLGGSNQIRPDYITPDQVRGAAMSTIINGAQFLAWFNQSFGPSQALDCQTNNVIRQAQVNPTGCNGRLKENIDAMGEVNNHVHALAPVLNTQSYEWSFGQNLDTMLKVKDGSAYVFAMTEGTDGNRKFTLPPGVKGSSAEVLNENRSIPINDGQFSDDFAKESTYHIYKISLD